MEVPEIRQQLRRLDVAMRKLLKRLEKQFNIRCDDGSAGGDPLVVSRIDVEDATYVTTRVPVGCRPRLSRREREIAVLVAEGLHNREIGEKLDIRAATVAAHLQRVFRKLGVTGRASVARYVLLCGGFPPTPAAPRTPPADDRRVPAGYETSRRAPPMLESS